MDGTQRRCIGLDVHRDFAQVAICQGGQVVQAGTFATTPEGVREFAAGLGPADEVALEATGNTWAIVTVLASRAGRVVVANPGKTRAIAEAKVKTDKVDAAILAQLLAADYLPAVWQPDAALGALRRQVLRRAHIVRQRTRLELRAGLPAARGRKGTAARYSLKAVRAAERDLAAQGEAAYRTMVAAWQPARPARKKVTGAAASKGTRLIKPTG